MTSISAKTILIAIGAASLLASPALAQTSRTHTRHVQQVAPDAQAAYGQPTMMRAPFSSEAGDHYVDRATDPDPAIRSELLRDSNVYNGNE